MVGDVREGRYGGELGNQWCNSGAVVHGQRRLGGKERKKERE
jgi:hypothetical protein